MNTTYTAVTIGPIIESLDSARKTRELWGISFLFSYIIRKIVIELKENKVTVLLPYFEDDSEWINAHGAGLFPDRIFVSGKVDVHAYYVQTIKETSIEIENWFSNLHKRQESIIPITSPEIETYLLDYFRFIEISFNCQSGENIIKKGSTLLDSKELQTKIIPIDNYVGTDNPLMYFLYHVNGSFLFLDGFRNTRRRFPSLIEIGIKEFDQFEKEYQKIENKIEEKQEKFPDLNAEKFGGGREEDIMQEIDLIFPNSLKPTHKYIAIVQADGDNIGNIISKIGTNEKDIQKFSIKLMEYSKKATEIVLEYGGSPIYMGGDELFFIAPLTYNIEKNKTHILDMIKQLDDDFNSRIKGYAESSLGITESLPSLSFGISFSYFKFPLYEAKRMASNSLFEDIKGADKKNAIKIKFRKHSGQILELFIQKKNPDLWKSSMLFVTENLTIDSNFINSFTHKLRYQEDVLFEKIAKDENKLLNFFKNNFNENYKQQQNYFESIQKFILVIQDNISIVEERSAYLYTILRYIHFLRA